MLQAENLHKVYHSGKKPLEILKGVNLNIEQGRFIAVVGPSGAGKSTLLHILGGLDSPTRGRVFLDSQDIYGLSDEALSGLRSRKVGFVFQFYHLLSEFTVLENVAMPALISCQLSVSSCQLKEKAKRILEDVGLGERTAHFPSQLSGGEKQRSAIARALINNPQVLFCDEPTGNLDSKNGSHVIALLKKINLENKTTVVMVTHNPELAKTADAAYYLKDGILVNREDG